GHQGPPPPLGSRPGAPTGLRRTTSIGAWYVGPVRRPTRCLHEAARRDREVELPRPSPPTRAPAARPAPPPPRWRSDQNHGRPGGALGVVPARRLPAPVWHTVHPLQDDAAWPLLLSQMPCRIPLT